LVFASEGARIVVFHHRPPVITIKRMIAGDAFAVGLVEQADIFVVERFGPGQLVGLAVVAPFGGLAEAQQRDQIQQRRRGLGQLEGLQELAGFDHQGALFQPPVGGAAKLGVIVGQLGRLRVRGRLRGHFGDLAHQSFGLCQCHHRPQIPLRPVKTNHFQPRPGLPCIHDAQRDIGAIQLVESHL
jgi:hypothetical protein